MILFGNWLNLAGFLLLCAVAGITLWRFRD